MLPSGIWNQLKKDPACKKFELRGTDESWGIYCTEADNISDPDMSQKCTGKNESDVKKALRTRCKQLMASDHGNIEMYRYVLSLKECGGQHKDAQKFLDKHLARASRTAPPIEKQPLTIKLPPFTMLDVPLTWNPMHPAETWSSAKMTEYIRYMVTVWAVSKDLAVLPRILQLEKVGEYIDPTDIYDWNYAVFKIYFEHPMSKAAIALKMRERDMRDYYRCLDCHYNIHRDNLQEETPISKAERTRYSQFQEFRKREEEWKRIQREQAYIHVDTSFDDWHTLDKKDEKERADEQSRIYRKRKQEIEERAARREAHRQAHAAGTPSSSVPE